MRVGNMTLFASDGKLCAQWAAATIFNDIAKRVGTWGFANEAIGDFLIARFKRFNDFHRPIDGRAFFICGD